MIPPVLSPGCTGTSCTQRTAWESRTPTRDDKFSMRWTRWKDKLSNSVFALLSPVFWLYEHSGEEEEEEEEEEEREEGGRAF